MRGQAARGQGDLPGRETGITVTRSPASKENRRDSAPSLTPAYGGWHDLAIHSGMSKRWLQANVPLRLRFQTGGKILVRLAEFDSWFEVFRQGQDLAAIEEELLK